MVTKKLLKDYLDEYKQGKPNEAKEFDLAVKELKTILKTVAEKYGLFLVQD